MEVKGTLRYPVVASALAAVATSPPRSRVREAATGRMLERVECNSGLL